MKKLNHVSQVICVIRPRQQRRLLGIAPEIANRPRQWIAYLQSPSASHFPSDRLQLIVSICTSSHTSLSFATQNLTHLPPLIPLALWLDTLSELKHVSGLQASEVELNPRSSTTARI